jgi:hypothetical protein
MPPAKEEEVIFMTSPSRRVVKAKAPPPSLDLVEDEAVAEATEDAEDAVAHVSYAVKSPSVERELEQEQVDKWRKERYVGMVEKKKAERQKEVMTRRQSSKSPTPPATASGSIPAQVLEEFSVEPKYPEHKRSGDTITGISEGEPQGKRRKASVDGYPDEDNGGGSVSKMVVVSALVAAVAIGVALFRRRAAGV